MSEQQITKLMQEISSSYDNCFVCIFRYSSETVHKAVNHHLALITEKIKALEKAGATPKQIAGARQHHVNVIKALEQGIKSAHWKLPKGELLFKGKKWVEPKKPRRTKPR